MQFGANGFLLVVLARVHHELVRQPVRGDHADVGGDHLQFFGRGDHFAVRHELLAELARKAHLVADDLLEMCFERTVARQQIIQITIQETIAPGEIDHVLQVRPHLVDRGAVIVGKAQTLFDLLLELAEDAVDDVVFVAEVVVQVAWTDFHFLGDRRGRDVRLADFVEQFQRQFEDPFAGAAGRFGFHVVRPWLRRAGRVAACRSSVIHPDAVGILSAPAIFRRAVGRL